MLNPFQWIRTAYRNAAAAGLHEFHADLSAAAAEAGVTTAQPLTLAALGEMLPKMLPAVPEAEPAPVKRKARE